MKRVFRNILFAVFILMGITACEDQLDQLDPNRVTVDTFWTTEDEFNQGLNSVYSALQLPTISGGGLVDGMMRTDFAGTESWYAVARTMSNMAWTDGWAWVNNRWSQLYIGVFRANQILDKLAAANIEGFTDEEKLSMEAQARFIRGICYFWLANDFNGAVIHDELAVGEDDFQKAFSAKAEVISQVVLPDFQFAYENLPKEWDDENLGRVTWGAAASMLGKTYLYDKNFAEAAKFFKEVIDEGSYRLVDTYMDNFIEEAEFNAESIFEVAFSNNYKPNTSGNAHDGQTGSEATSIANAFASIVNAGGFNTCLPTYWLQELFVAGDSIDVSSPKNVDRRYSTRTFASIVVEFGDGDYYQSPLTTVDPEDPSKANFNFGQGSKVKKWTGWYKLKTEDVATQARSGNNFRHIRLADVYLMYAEAVLESTGDVAEAMKYIDMVRSRAGVLTLQHYVDNNGGRIPRLDMPRFPNGLSAHNLVTLDANSLMTHIRMVERPLELAFEGHRWYDLVRWGIVKETFEQREQEENKIVNILGNPIAPTTPKMFPLYLNQRVRLDFGVPNATYSSSDHDYLPIPSSEILSNREIN